VLFFFFFFFFENSHFTLQGGNYAEQLHATLACTRFTTLQTDGILWADRRDCFGRRTA